MAKKDMAAMLDGFEAKAQSDHSTKVAAAVGAANDTRATALVSMSKDDKKKLTATAKAHVLSLSAFFRLAADEYIKNHGWEVED